MGRICIYCKEKQTANSEISFHKFPTKDPIKKMWIKSIPKDIIIKKSAFLCSKHFTEENFSDCFGRNGRVLKFDAIPTIFEAENKENQKPSSENINVDKGTHQPRISTEDIISKIESDTETCSDKSDHGNFAKKQKVIASEDIVSMSIITTALSNQSNVDIAEEYNMPSTNKNDYNAGSTTLTATSFSSTLTASSEVPTTFSAKQIIRKRGIKRRRVHYVGDVHTSDFSTPTKAKKNLKFLKDCDKVKRRKIKYLSARNKHLRQKVQSLKSLVSNLLEKNFITENAASTLMATLPGTAAEIMKKILKGSKKQKYTPELRKFAITLNFYSKKAYEYVRKTFNNSLPHNSTITKWYRSVDASPGFTHVVVNILKEKADEAEKSGKTLLCNLVMDEMSIRKQVEWDGTKFTGLIDIGTNLDSDDVPQAKEVLVFMLVAINDFWKLPVGYFFLNGLSGMERANLVVKCLEFLAETNIKIVGLTFDGAPSNLAMIEHLGANVKHYKTLQTFFEHPIEKYKIFIFPDACHMLKLVRNCLASKQTIFKDKQPIRWFFFEKLVTLQEKEGLHAGNKIRSRNVRGWRREIMKVKLASQTFSLSVANSFEYLCQDLKLPEFQGCEETVTFIKLMNNLFDIFNSKNLFSKYTYKKPISQNNFHATLNYFDYVKDYFYKITISDNTPILLSGRKVGFLGFLIGIESIINFYKQYVDGFQLLMFIPTYKLSQDHIEMYFSIVRSRGGFNNNPTAKQFETTYKRLLVHNELKASHNANAVEQENTNILYIPSTSLTKCQAGDECLSGSEDNDFSEEINFHYDEIHEYCQSEVWHLTEYAKDIVSYIAGFVAKKVIKLCKCNVCSKIVTTHFCSSRLQQRKAWGNLINAAPFVIKLCCEAEKRIKYYKTENKFYNKKRNLSDVIITNICSNYDFTEINELLGDHLFNYDVVDNHTHQLAKLILKTYITLRFHHETKLTLEMNVKDRIRSNLSKLILHKHQ